MTVPVSTVPAAKAALLAAINTQSAITNPPAGKETQVFYGNPPQNGAEDQVYIAGVTRTASALAMVGSLGAGAVQENYTITVVCDSYRGDDPEGASERAWALASAVDAAARNDPTLAGTVLEAIPGQSNEVAGWDEDFNGFRAQITLAIDVLAII